MDSLHLPTLLDTIPPLVQNLAQKAARTVNKVLHQHTHSIDVQPVLLYNIPLHLHLL